MKYKEVIKERNLDPQNLPVKMKSKIKSLDRLKAQVDKMDRSSFDPEEKEELEAAKIRVDALDEELADDLRAFDPELYARQRERMNKINKSRVSAQTTEPEPEPEPEIEPNTDDTDLDDEDDDEYEHEEYEEEDDGGQDDEPLELDRVPPVSKTLNIKQDLDRLKDTASVSIDDFRPERDDDPLEDERGVEPEIEEFSKDEDAKPKKMSKGLILMGVGAFLLTWGAVNFFKERRG